MTKLSNILTLLILLTGLTAFAQKTSSLKGTWQFNGGVYNGKPDKVPKDYKMQRIYTDKDFSAFASQPGYTTEKYETGKYTIKGDTCFEMQTYSSRPSQTLNKTVAYFLTFKKNELILAATLPSGMVVEEHWLRISPVRKK